MIQYLLIILSLVSLFSALDLGKRTIATSDTATGYCDSFSSFTTDFWAGYEKRYVIIGCTYGKGVYIHDAEDMKLVKSWLKRNWEGVHYYGTQHSSSIEVYDTILVTLEDWNGIEGLDYTSDAPGDQPVLKKFMCQHSLCSSQRTVHRQMIQLIDPQTQQGGKFIYAYSGGFIRFTKINKNGGQYSWQELRDAPVSIGNEVKGVSQLDGTTLVIISTASGFKIFDGSYDNLPEISTTTDATRDDLDCQFATHIKGTRIIVTYDSGYLKVFEISPPDIFPIKITLVKKHYTNRSGYIQELKSMGGRQLGLITNNYAEVYDIGVINNENINTEFEITRQKNYFVDDFGNYDFSCAIFRIPDSNYIIYNDNNFSIYIDYVCHYTCQDCQHDAPYGKCSSCNNSTNMKRASDGLLLEKSRELQPDGTCDCIDTNNPCTYVDIGSRFCYHETVFSDSPTKCCGTNSCKNDYASDQCIARSNECPKLEQLDVIFDERSGYWYYTRGSPKWDCYYNCYYCYDINFDNCRGCDDDNTNRHLVNGQCKCKDGYYQKNSGDVICSKIIPCVPKCTDCEYGGQCNACVGSQQYKNIQTCECQDGYKDDGNDGCIRDCRDDVTKRENSGNNCVCQTGYQETDPVSDNCEEIPCVAKCASCRLGVCLQCQGNQDFKDPQTCECNPGYKNKSNGIDCELDCKTSTTNRVLDNGVCVCDTGYYEKNVGDTNCTELPCQPKCQTCDRGNCQQCIGTNNNRNLQTCECNAGFWDNNNVCINDCNGDSTNRENDLGGADANICVCKQGYEENTPIDANCKEKECGYKCSQCSLGVCSRCFGNQNNKQANCECDPGYKYFDEDSNCHTDCDNNNTKRENDFANNDANKCVCQNGYEDLSPLTDNDNCTEIPCVSACVSCSLGVCSKCQGTQGNKDPQQCTCVSGFEMVGTDCLIDCDTTNTKRVRDSSNTVCVCDTGYQEKNPVAANCEEIPCVSECTTCSLGICSLCNGGNDNKDGQTCECNVGYYKDDNTNKCIFDCETHFTNKILISGTNCQCKKGFELQNPTDYVCQEIPCVAKCEVCELGECKQCFGQQENRDINGDCDCIDDYKEYGDRCMLDCRSRETFKYLNLLTETCECSNGYYLVNENDDVCTELPCEVGCKTCKKGICQQCKGKPIYRNQQTCQCDPFTVEINLDDGEDSNDECILIKKGLNRNPDQPFGCQDGFYEQEFSYDCIPCSPLCKTCSRPDQCEECALPFFTKPPSCQWFSKFFNEMNGDEEELDIDDLCDAQIGCAECDQETGDCLTCDETLNRSFNKFTRTCDCNPGFKDFRSQAECQKCYYYHGECILQCPQNSHVRESDHHCIDIQYEGSDNLPYIAALVAGIVITLAATTFAMTKMHLRVMVKEVVLEEENRKVDPVDQDSNESGSEENQISQV